ncbi:MAG: MraY family glycosyltransferase [Planctomycetota bacterium]|jgi:UDP-GlcNAc:undecaprenyl-phosphate GlcNAc-1-phosphate transferase
MLLLFAVVFVLAFLVSLNAVPRFMRLALRTGLVDRPGPHKIHRDPVPYGGGLGVALAVLLVVFGGAAAAAARSHFGWPQLPDHVERHIPGVVSRLPRLAVLLCGSLVILLLGLVDDRHRLGAPTKLFVQTAVALGMALGCERLSLFAEGTLVGDIVGTAVTVLWIVGVTNAFNLLDHMDGLSGGVAAVAGLCFFAVAVRTEQWFIAASLAAMIGACAGFLVYNFPPAKVFLGDAGSLFVGFFLASLTVSFTFYDSGASYPFYAYAVPLVVLAVPLFDTSSVVWIRLKERRNPLRADTNHFAHRLTDLGLGRRAAVLVIYALTLLTGASAVLLYDVGPTGALVILGQIGTIFVIITILESWGRRRHT